MPVYRIEKTDCFEWLRQRPAHSLNAVCTDPPYGILEFTEKEIAKLRAGRGGVWRLPPKVGGSHRDPLPRFTVLSNEQKHHLRNYFRDWGALLLRVLVPGGHVCVAGHPILQHHVQGAMAEAGFEVRPAIMGCTTAFAAGTGPRMPRRNFQKCVLVPKARMSPGCCSASRLMRRPWRRICAIGEQAHFGAFQQTSRYPMQSRVDALQNVKKPFPITRA